MALWAPFPWFGDAMAYAKAHVAGGVLRVDADGRIWRTAIRLRNGEWSAVKERRAENVGGRGYLRVSLWIPGQRRLAVVMAHNLVYEVLVGQIPQGLELNHEDLNKTNNHPRNLKPMTGAENIQHSYANGRTRPWTRTHERHGDWRKGRPVLTVDQRAEIRAQRAAGLKLSVIAEEFGLSTTHVHRVCLDDR